MKLLSFVARKLIKLKLSVSWYAQFYQTKKSGLIPRNVSLLRTDRLGKILLIAPHADDEWIGGFSLLNLRKREVECCYMNLYGNDYSDKNIYIRNKEIVDSSEFWNFKLINNHDYDENALAASIKIANSCFIPSPYDWHPEHRETFRCFFKAFCLLSTEEQLVTKVYYYSVSVPHCHKEELKYIPLSQKEINMKWADFVYIYKSQSFMPALRYKLQLRLVPAEIGYAAQTFIEADKARMLKDNLAISDRKVIDSLNESFHDINNIKKSRDIVNNVRK